jgi:hypothetical protein
LDSERGGGAVSGKSLDISAFPTHDPQMTEKSNPPGPRVREKARAAQEARRARKAALLRENLLKRKAQSRERAHDGDPPAQNGDKAPD